MSYPTIQAAMNSGETLVFGHRGAMAAAPMNTLAAFDLACQQGADGIELDAQLSRDNQAVVIHDYQVDATTDRVGKVADFTAAELQALDAGAWFASEFAGQRIPTLDEVFAAYGAELFINVEIKSDDRESALLAATVADCIKRRAMTDRVIVSSFNPPALRRFAQLCPLVMTGFLYVPGSADEAAASMNGVAHDAKHPWHEAIDADYMAWAESKGYRVNAWTVNDPARARELKRLGVSTIITDGPAAMIAALQSC